MADEEMKEYIGTKKIKAKPQKKNSEKGYKVKYPDGYVSWSPKDVFEKAYIEVNKLNYKDAIKMLNKAYN